MYVGENDAALFAENNLVKPTVIVLKKNARVLKLWSNILGATGFMKGNPLFVIDDEADAASLNTMVNQGEQSSINKYLDKIKNDSSSSIYLQVTGTPQSILLQTMESGWHPYFIYYFKPGSAYLGGDFFSRERGIRNTLPSSIHWKTLCAKLLLDIWPYLPRCSLPAELSAIVSFIQA